MQAGVGLLDTDVMPICIIIALDIIITLRFSSNCSTVICSPTVLIAFKRETSSEIYAPRVYFPSYTFRSIYQQYQKIPCCNLFTYILFYVLVIFYIYLYQISLLQVAVNGLTTPLSRWLQGSWLFVQVLGDLCVVSYWIDTLVIKLREILISTLLHHPFLFKGKTNTNSRSSNMLPPCAFR